MNLSGNTILITGGTSGNLWPGICGRNLWPDGTGTFHIHADSQKPQFRLATKLSSGHKTLATKLQIRALARTRAIANRRGLSR
jgi:hypothetical protein